MCLSTSTSRSLTAGWVCMCDGLKEKRGRDGLLCGMEGKKEKRKKKEETREEEERGVHA